MASTIKKWKCDGTSRRNDDRPALHRILLRDGIALRHLYGSPSAADDRHERPHRSGAPGDWAAWQSWLNPFAKPDGNVGEQISGSAECFQFSVPGFRPPENPSSGCAASYFRRAGFQQANRFVKPGELSQKLSAFCDVGAGGYK